jgi:hypothetical protein
MTTKTAEAAPSLAERLERARQAEVAPRQHVAEIEAALKAAEERRDWAEVLRLENELQPAREAGGFAAAVTGALAGQVAVIDAERRDREAARAKVQQRDEAQRVVDNAMEAEKQTLAGIEAALAEMNEHLEAAHRAYQAALSWQAKAGQERQRAANARGHLSEYPPGHSAPRVSAPNKASVLADRDPLVAALA